MSVLAEVRRGLRDAPGDETLKQNLVIALHNNVTTLMRAGKCAEVKALQPELDPADARFQAAVKQACP